jgi:hypothetical protein
MRLSLAMQIIILGLRGRTNWRSGRAVRGSAAGRCGIGGCSCRDRFRHSHNVIRHAIRLLFVRIVGFANA